MPKALLNIPPSPSPEYVLAKLILVECVQTQQLHWGGWSRVGGPVGTNPHIQSNAHTHTFSLHCSCQCPVSMPTHVLKCPNVKMSFCVGSAVGTQHKSFPFIFMPQFGSKELSTANLPQFPMLKHNYAMPLISRNSSYFWQWLKRHIEVDGDLAKISGISAQNITNDHFSTDPAKAACV